MQLGDKNEALYQQALKIKLQGKSWAEVQSFLELEEADRFTREFIFQKLVDDWKNQEFKGALEQLKNKRRSLFIKGFIHLMMGLAFLMIAYWIGQQIPVIKTIIHLLIFFPIFLLGMSVSLKGLFLMIKSFMI